MPKKLKRFIVVAFFSFTSSYYKMDIHPKSNIYIPDVETKGANILPSIKSRRDYLFAKLIPATSLWKIQVDDVSLYSVTEGGLANEMSALIFEEFKSLNNGKSAIITDATACVGGNTISFAKVFGHVNAVEIDPIRSKMLIANIATAQVGKKVSVFPGKDYIDIMKSIEQNIIFIDPPWGGVDYKNKDVINMNLGTMDIADVILALYSEKGPFQSNTETILHARREGPLIVFKAPLNYNIEGFQSKIANSTVDVKIHKVVVFPKMKLYFITKGGW